jgi:hypothetical protein
MNYLTLGFSMACFVAAAMLALSAPAFAVFGG